MHVLLAFVSGLCLALFLVGFSNVRFDARVSLTESLGLFLTVVMGLYIANVVQRKQSSRNFLVSYIVEQVSTLEKKLYEIEGCFVEAKGRTLNDAEKRYVLSGFTFVKRSVHFLIQDSEELLGDGGKPFLGELLECSMNYWRETTAGSFPNDKIGARVSSVLKREQVEFQRYLRVLVHKVNYS
jgi:hypothetical protein